MIVVRWVLLLRDETDKRIGTLSTGTEPLGGVRGRSVTSRMHRLLNSCFNMHPDAASIDIVSLEGWRAGAGMDLDLQPLVLTARKTEETRALSDRALLISFPSPAESEAGHD